MFRTEFPKQTSDLNITHQDKLILLGSCFTQNIGSKLDALKFNTLNNPFGIIYNPISLFKSLNIICEQKKYQPTDLVFNNEQYHSFDHHSSFSNPDRQQCLNAINSNNKLSLTFLKNAKFCFISLGTAFTYKHSKLNKVVANCHKIHNTQFNKKLLSVQEIVDSFELTIQYLKSF